MDPDHLLSKDQCPKTKEEFEDMRDVPYRRAIGLLMYASTGTRPDIAFPVSTLSQFMSNPGRPHWEALKRVFRYLNTTKDYKLTYGQTNDGLNVYSDSDWASQEHQHSISGHAAILNGGAIAWSSAKQHLVALSTAEAEYMAATNAMKTILWLRMFLGEIARPLYFPTQLFLDNQSAICLTKDSRYHARTKHIDARYHFIRETVERGEVKVDYCPTEEMPADVLTKGMNGPRTRWMAHLLGLRQA